MQKNKILIVEDEIKVANFIMKGLQEYDYDVDVANDGVIGKNKVLSNTYNLIILDINLPLLNGIQLCEIIREQNHQTPILMLTAYGSIEQKIMGFESGADDYLLKPFEFKELLLRINALIKRSLITQQQLIDDIISIDDLEIHRNTKTAIRSGKTIELTAKEFALLEYLALNKNRVVSKTEIAEHVWGISFDTQTNTIEVYINFLRKKIEPQFKHKLIHTRVGLGYTMNSINNLQQ